MKKTYMKYALIVIVLLSIALVSGCIAQQPAAADVPKIKSQEEVQKVTENVTQDIGNVKNTLNDLDKSFG